MCAGADDPPPFPGGRLLPTRLQLAAQRCTPNFVAVDYHPCQVTDVWSTGSLATQYARPTGLRVQQPPESAAAWWIDDVYKPRPLGWWEAALRRHLSLPDPTKVLWAACYEESPSWIAMSRHGCTWYATIPSGALRMRSCRAVIQTSPTTRNQLLARNPRALCIGAIHADTSHETSHHFRHCWRDELQYDYDSAWMPLEHLHRGSPGAEALHGLAMWSPAITTTFPEQVELSDRTWLLDTFADVYAAPSGWRTWPSASPSTTAWAQAVCTSRRQSAILHTGVLRAIWDANHAHWRRTCSINHDAIVAAGDLDELTEANDHVSRGVRTHQHLTFGLDTRLSSTLARQAQLTTAWRHATG